MFEFSSFFHSSLASIPEKKVSAYAQYENESL